jgi:hypothetical protein
MSQSSAVSPNRRLVAIHSQPKDGISKRLIIKCYDSNVSIGTLKFTLSANLKDDTLTGQGLDRLHFATDECLLASLSNNKILVFDLSRGVHSQTINVSGGDLCAYTGKDNLVYALIKKEGKSVVFIHDTQKEGKVVKKVKCGACDDDDRLGIAVHPTEDMIGVCIGKKMKIIQVSDGQIVAKSKIKSKDEGKVPHGEKSGCLLQFSSDGTVIGASTPNSVHLFSVKSGIRVGLINASDASSIYINSTEENQIVAVVSKRSKAFLAEVTLSNKKSSSAIDPFSTITLPTSTDNTTIINEVFFSPGKKGGSNVILSKLTPRGMNNIDVSMTQVSYRTESNKLQSGELYPDSSESQDDKSKKSLDDATASKKRKMTPTNVVLGPGESGGEALVVTDQTAVKRSKVSEDDDGDEFALEKGDVAEESIAQRLALLSSELDRDTEDEEELLKIQSQESNKSIIKSATSESLSILLRQALTANDDAQLEVALNVSDKRVIENSVLGLANEPSDEADNGENSEIIIMLLTKLVTRISRKPSRAQRLAFWIRTVLVALIAKLGSTENMGKTEREIASRLGPLRNMLSERVESLPELLRLEGRLSLLNSQL